MGGDGKNSKLVTVALQFIMGKMGGMGGLISTFQKNGMGDVISSWISQGPNKDVTPDDLEKGFGRDNIFEIAKEADMPKETVTTKLSEILPNLVDKMSPNGEVPDGNLLEKGLHILKRSL